MPCAKELRTIVVKQENKLVNCWRYVNRAGSRFSVETPLINIVAVLIEHTMWFSIRVCHGRHYLTPTYCLICYIPYCFVRHHHSGLNDKALNLTLCIFSYCSVKDLCFQWGTETTMGNQELVFVDARHSVDLTLLKTRQSHFRQP